MPQLMPLYWSISIFNVIFILLMMLNLFISFDNYLFSKTNNNNMYYNNIWMW